MTAPAHGLVPTVCGHGELKGAVLKLLDLLAGMLGLTFHEQCCSGQKAHPDILRILEVISLSRFCHVLIVVKLIP